MSNKINKISLNILANKLRKHSFVVSKALRNTHLQTVLSQHVPYFKTFHPRAQRELISLPDGSQLVADCWLQKAWQAKATVIILSGFEGYAGSGVSQSGQGTGHKAYHFGFNVIFLRHRGEGDSITLTKSLFDASLEDTHIALAQIVKWGHKKLFMVGFSAGGHILLHLLETLAARPNKHIVGAVTISAATDMFQTWQHVEKKPLYDRFLLRQYKNLVRRRAKVDPPGMWDLSQLDKIKTKREWAETYLPYFNLPKSGRSLEQYNQSIDIVPLLPKIKVPTLIIHALDDPITPSRPFTSPEVQASPHIITLLPKNGGHVGFISHKKLYEDLDLHWAQNRTLEFINQLAPKNTPPLD